MPDKPTTAAGYPADHAQLVRATCLYVATKLGDLADEVVVIGGLAGCCRGDSLLADSVNDGGNLEGRRRGLRGTSPGAAGVVWLAT